ncbi:conserved protein of unknown function; putative acyltransferase domain [Blastococcus saxobsidens DD2]|uniref:Uncharacterized protein n=1 Tax=Blastococcus saxobsidens (strain DD2) TaxID=1146883 RepID=H6RP55_BLASD|nr:conserved protein of unknown function; putative acyltransferase domain [Blastococcus saxobsidens DD2]
MLLALTASGCSSSSDPGPSSSPTSGTSTSRTPSPSPTAPSPAEEAQELAVDLVPEYLRMIDDLYLDPSLALDGIYEVAVAPEATAQATGIGKFRSQGYRQTGRSQLVTASAVSVDLSNDPAASPSPVFPTVVVSACVDVSQVDAVDATGQSIVPPDRPRYLVQQLTVVNPDYPDTSSWRVSEAPNRQAESCDG